MTRIASSADNLYLWFLGEPIAPVLVGELNLVMGRRAVSLRYAKSWIAHGFALSEDLPLRDVEYFPKDKDTAVGAVDDARPDRWGERIICLLDRPARLSLLEFLYFAGDDRFGALGVSTSSEIYLPRKIGALPRLADIESVHETVHRILANEPIDERQKRLIAPGVTMGGARPKALCQINGEDWMVKFAESDRPVEPLVEHATMTLAAKVGINSAETQPLQLSNGIAIAIRRFDRVQGKRLHVISANVALKAAGSELSYPNLALILRRRAPAQTQRKQMHELFRRLIFNILIDNTDDHEKNHALIVDANQNYILAPAYDVLPTGYSLGYQAMTVGEHGAQSTVENALTAAAQYWLTHSEAMDQASQVAIAVNDWRSHFEACGVDSATLDELALHIDRPFLVAQRAWLANPALPVKAVDSEESKESCYPNPDEIDSPAHP